MLNGVFGVKHPVYLIGGDSSSKTRQNDTVFSQVKIHRLLIVLRELVKGREKVGDAAALPHHIPNRPPAQDMHAGCLDVLPPGRVQE